MTNVTHLELAPALQFLVPTTEIPAFYPFVKNRWECAHLIYPITLVLIATAHKIVFKTAHATVKDNVVVGCPFLVQIPAINVLYLPAISVWIIVSSAILLELVMMGCLAPSTTNASTVFVLEFPLTSTTVFHARSTLAIPSLAPFLIAWRADIVISTEAVIPKVKLLLTIL
jgi:hypothetical protein